MKKIQPPKYFTRSFLQELLPKNAVIIEAGAHVGNDTLKLSKLFPAGTIHAFEPIPEIFNQLCSNVKNIPNIHIYQTALSDTTSSCRMFVTEGVFSTTSSLLEPQELRAEHPDITYHTITVPTVTLDAWAQKHAIKCIDFMWLDAQGSELAILKGAQTLLPTMSALLVEVNITERYKNVPHYHEIRSWLEHHNFEVMLEHLHHASWGNVLFYNKNLIAIDRL